MPEKDLYRVNDLFKKSIHWLHLNGEEFDDQEIASKTGYTRQQISRYKTNKDQVSSKFIRLYEEKFLSKHNCRLEYFENPAPLPSAKYTEEEQALIMLNTKIEKLQSTMDLLLEMVERISPEKSLKKAAITVKRSVSAKK